VWRDAAKRRKFMDDFAKSKNFDPLDVEKWYSVTMSEIRNNGGSGVLWQHKNSLKIALKELYPGQDFHFPR